MGFYAEPIESATTAEFDVTLEVLKWGRVYSKDQLGNEATILGSCALRDVVSAPRWVQKWVGPTRFDLSITCGEFWQEVDNFLAQNVGWDPNGGKMRPDIPAEVYRVLQEECLPTAEENTDIIDAPVDIEEIKKEHADMQQALNYIAFLTGPGCVFVPENTGYVAAEVVRKVIGDMVKERNKAVSLSPQFKR